MSTATQSNQSHARLRDTIERELATLFTHHGTAAQAYGADFSRLWNLASQHVQGGKLVRPLLLLETFDAMSHTESIPTGEREVAVSIAAAVEALHYAFLLHDDIIDGDVVRRGRPNLMGELENASADRALGEGAQHWAQTGGILVGDLLLSASHQLFARADVPHATRLRLLDLLEHIVLETTAGEYADVGLSHGVITPDLSTVLAMTTRKTATYTFELPLRAAVILAGGSEDLESALSAAGAHLGLAYQLQDDLLSTFGDCTVHGKDPYSDLREGKQTAIVCFARMTSAWPSIEADLGDPELSHATAERLRDLLRECGAERFVQGLIEEQLTAFYEVIAGRGSGDRVPAQVRHVLLDLATRLEGRQS